MRRPAARLALLAVAACAALLLAGTAPAAAQTCNASIDNLAFGPIDTLSGGNIDRTANVTISCQSTLGAAVCPGINAGPAGLAADGSRLMTSAGGQSLRFQLYQDATRLVPWCSLENPALGTTPRIVLPGGNSSVTVPLYARIFGGQSTVPIGDYSAAFSGAQTGFYYGGVNLGCSLILLGNVTRPAFDVRAQVASNCLVEADDLDFGSQGLLNAAVSAASRVRVRCTPGASYSISLGGGSSGSGLPRFMTRTGGPGQIAYGLYQDPANAVPWTTASLVSGVGDGLTRTIPVYGLVPAQPTPPAGRYTDVVVVTVTH